MTEGAAPFGRILAALPTPLDERGRLDNAALEHLVRYFAERKLSGVTLLGEVGEGAYLDGSERRIVVERACKVASDGLPVYVQVGDAWTRSAVESAQHAETKGASGIILDVPPLPGVGYPEIYRHLDRVARAVQIEVLLYIRPGGLVSALAPEEQGALAQHPRLAGAHIAGGAHASLKAWARRFERRGAHVLAGSSFDILELARHGATGAVCALSVLAPEPARAMMESMRRGDVEQLRRVRKRMAPAMERMGPPRGADARGSVEKLAERLAQRPLDGGGLRPFAPPALLKEGLRLQGHRIKAFVRPPQPQITDEERTRLEALMRSCGMLA